MQINFALNIPDFHHCKMQDNKYFVHSNVCLFHIYIIYVNIFYLSHIE